MTSQRAAGIGILCLNLGFVALSCVAMTLYPGGTWLEPARAGHAFWANFLCDLLHTQALSGADNSSGALFARLAMLAEAGALVLMWWAAPFLFPRRSNLGKGIRILGVLSTLGTLAVVLLPSDRFGALHGVMVLLASVPGFGAAVLTVSALLESETHRVGGAFGALALLTSLVSFVLYARTQFFGAALTVSVPASQRIATFAVVAFCVAVALRLLSPMRAKLDAD